MQLYYSNIAEESLDEISNYIFRKFGMKVLEELYDKIDSNIDLISKKP